MTRLPGIAYVVALAAALVVAATIGIVRHDKGVAQLHEAHVATLAATDTVRVADTVFVHDTVPLAPARAAYRAKRDTALVFITDTVAVKQAFAAADNALELDSTAIASAARSIRAHVVLEDALRTELRISEKLRAPRYSLVSRAGFDVDGLVPLTELESSVRITSRWSLAGRVSKRWAAGEPTRRYVLASYSF
jgi:hypothetical protein